MRDDFVNAVSDVLNHFEDTCGAIMFDPLSREIYKRAMYSSRLVEFTII